MSLAGGVAVGVGVGVCAGADCANVVATTAKAANIGWANLMNSCVMTSEISLDSS